MLHQTIYGSINVKRKAYRKEATKKKLLPNRTQTHSVIAIEWAKKSRENEEKKEKRNIFVAEATIHLMRRIIC